MNIWKILKWILKGVKYKNERVFKMIYDIFIILGLEIILGRFKV